MNLPLGDLGSQIKYCIVFPFLENTGVPLPVFNVPLCPLGTTPENAPRLTVVKVVINDDAGFATTTDFTLSVNSTRVTSGSTRVLAPGAYVVSEATTTVTIGTTTMQYTQSFSGACDSTGLVTLALNDVKTCTIINDDAGPGGQGGEGPGDSGGGNNGDGNGNNNGNGDNNGNGNGNGGSHGGRGHGGRVLGQSTPVFMGGGDGAPGIPNTGSDGSGALGLLIFSFTSSLLGAFSLRMTLKEIVRISPHQTI